MAGILKYFPTVAILLTGILSFILTSCQQPVDSVSENQGSYDIIERFWY